MVRAILSGEVGKGVAESQQRDTQREDNFACVHNGRTAATANDQLTDGGPPGALEIGGGVAGPPFGEALGSDSAPTQR